MTISEQEFLTWLKTKHSMEIVGNINGARDCPVARFLNQTRGPGHRVGMDDYGYKDGNYIGCPPWVRPFIERCMDRVPWWVGKVMASQAIDALDGKPAHKSYRIILWIDWCVRKAGLA